MPSLSVHSEIARLRDLCTIPWWSQHRGSPLANAKSVQGFQGFKDKILVCSAELAPQEIKTMVHQLQHLCKLYATMLSDSCVMGGLMFRLIEIRICRRKCPRFGFRVTHLSPTLQTLMKKTSQSSGSPHNSLCSFGKPF